MPRRAKDRPVPPATAVTGPAFRVGEALALGHTRWSTSPTRMTAPTRAVRTPTPLTTAAELAAAFALALPEDVAFSHTTAARIWGLPLPRAIWQDHRVHVMRTTARSWIVRTGCASHKGLERRDVVHVGGLRVTSLADTWLDLVATFADRLSLADVVMVGDAVVERLHPTKFVHDHHPVADPASMSWWRDPVARGCDDLLVRFLDRSKFPGRALARQALELVRPRVWSPMESYSRVVIVQGDLPEPALNVAIRSEREPARSVVGDMAWKKKHYRHKVVGEYNGSTHEEDRSRETDHAKRLLLEDQGWKVLEIYSRDVFTTPGRLALLRRLADWLGL